MLTRTTAMRRCCGLHLAVFASVIGISLLALLIIVLAAISFGYFGGQNDHPATIVSVAISLLAFINLGLLSFVALYVRSRGHEAQLQRSNEAKDQFVGVVSHELRNPIGTIMGAASILQRRGDALSSGERDDLLRIISDDAERLEQRVSNMLMVTRPEDPKAHFEPLLLQRAIPRVVEFHRRQFPTRYVSLQVDDTLPPVNGNGSFFEQILLNFLGNAEKYGHPTAAIEVRASRDGHAVRVEVLDRGETLDPSILEKLFQPFFRTESARRTAPGTGLGLTVCRRLVEMQDGRIWAEPRPGGGSIFAFTLPCVIEEFEQVTEPATNRARVYEEDSSTAGLAVGGRANGAT